MSKKNKQKRKQSQQRRDYHYQPTTATPVQSVKVASTESLLTPVEGAHTKPALFGDTDGHIRRDIIRIVIILGILLVVLVGTVIINRKTTLIQRAGSHFSSFLQL